MQKRSASAGTTSKGDVYVVGPAFYGVTADVFRENGYRITDKMDTADIIVLTGGADINPLKFYGEEPLDCVRWNTTRDRTDLYAAQTGVDAGKFMVGICRGAQLLNCWPNGGTLWQDVDNHGGTIHQVEDHITGRKWKTNSVHHQMMRIAKNGNGILVASTSIATRKRAWKEHEGKGVDPEVIYYPETRSLLFQGHPEFGHPETTEYFFSLMDRYYLGRKPNMIAKDRIISHDSSSNKDYAYGNYDAEEEGTPPELLADCIVSQA